MSEYRKGDRFNWCGVSIEIKRVASDGAWADLDVRPPLGKGWTKRMGLPLPQDFKAVAS